MNDVSDPALHNPHLSSGIQCWALARRRPLSVALEAELPCRSCDGGWSAVSEAVMPQRIP